jgi:hypothetical protein
MGKKWAAGPKRMQRMRGNISPNAATNFTNFFQSIPLVSGSPHKQSAQSALWICFILRGFPVLLANPTGENRSGRYRFQITSKYQNSARAAEQEGIYEDDGPR